ncbi:7664_t:CDS:2, partial [Dentiscutata erythropus]
GKHIWIGDSRPNISNALQKISGEEMCYGCPLFSLKERKPPILEHATIYVGDILMGRTVPSLGDMIGCHADILAFVVLEVDLEWPIQ